MTASASGTSRAPASAYVPASVTSEMAAPCLPRPVTSEFMLGPAANRSASSIAMTALENRPFPMVFGGPGACCYGYMRPRGALTEPFVATWIV